MPRNTPPSLISYTEVAFNVTTSPRSSAVVSWNAGDFIVVGALSEGASAIGVPTATGLTFGSVVSNTAANTCASRISVATAATSSSSVITATNTLADTWGFGIWVYRGSDGIGSVGEQHTTTHTKSVVPTDTHSAWVILAGDFSAAAATNNLTPTVTNIDERAIENAAYTAYVGDITDQASGASTAYGLNAGGTAGVISLAIIEILGTTTSSLVYPPSMRVESTRSRAFFVAPRGKVSRVIPAQVPVPAPAPVRQVPAGRRAALLRKGRVVTPVPPQAAAVASSVVPRRFAPKRLLAATTKGKRTLHFPDHSTPPRPSRPPKIRLAARVFRGRGVVAPTDQSVPVRTAPRRLAAVLRRGRAASVTPAQVPVPAPAVPRTVGRWRWATLRKGRQTNPVLTQQAAAPPPYPPPRLGAARRLLSGAQRGRQVSPVPAQQTPVVPVLVHRVARARVRVMGTVRRRALGVPHGQSVPPRSAQKSRRVVAKVRRGLSWAFPWFQAIQPPPTIPTGLIEGLGRSDAERDSGAGASGDEGMGSTSGDEGMGGSSGLRG